MANISKNAEIRFLANGKSIDAPINWQDITIEAEYINDSIQPKMAIQDVRLNLSGRNLVNEWIEKGLSGGVGIFEGMPIEAQIFNNTNNVVSFKSFLDFYSGYEDFSDDGEVLVNLEAEESLQSLFDKLGGLTFGYLESVGVFSDSDYTNFDYVVEKKVNLIELAMTSVMLFIIYKELYESIYRTSQLLAEPPRAAGNAPFSVGDIIFIALFAIITTTYTAIILLTAVEMTKNLFEALIPPKRTHKTISVTTVLSKICAHLGYGFETSVSEYANLYYLPTNPNTDETTAGGFISVTKGTQKGIPNDTESFYFVENFFNLFKNLAYCKLAIINNVVQLRPYNDPFWVNGAVWKMTDTRVNGKKYNLDELKSTALISFSVDTSDDYTIDNYEGTAIEVKTTPISIIDEKKTLLKGIDDNNFSVSLPTIKTELNGLEKFLKSTAKVVDDVTGVLGGGTNYAQRIQSKLGILKQSTNWHTVPKLLYARSGILNRNQKDFLNAELLWDKYHNHKSFVSNNFGGQKEIYNNVTIGFGFDDFLQLKQNPFFNYNGLTAKIINFTWTIGQDEAVISFWVRKPYTKNLKETKIIPK